MVIDRQRVSAAGPQLPVRAGAHEQPVVRKEFRIGMADAGPETSRSKFVGQLTDVLGATRLGQGPTTRTGELDLGDPAERLEIKQALCCHRPIKSESRGNLFVIR